MVVNEQKEKKNEDDSVSVYLLLGGPQCIGKA